MKVLAHVHNAKKEAVKGLFFGSLFQTSIEKWGKENIILENGNLSLLDCWAFTPVYGTIEVSKNGAEDHAFRSKRYPALRA